MLLSSVARKELLVRNTATWALLTQGQRCSLVADNHVGVRIGHSRGQHVQVRSVGRPVSLKFSPKRVVTVVGAFFRGGKNFASDAYKSLKIIYADKGAPNDGGVNRSHLPLADLKVLRKVRREIYHLIPSSCLCNTLTLASLLLNSLRNELCFVFVGILGSPDCSTLWMFGWLFICANSWLFCLPWVSKKCFRAMVCNLETALENK